MSVVKEFLDGGRFAFVCGRFDAWMVDCFDMSYLSRYPKDEEIFNMVLLMAKLFGPFSIWEKFQDLFNLTDKNIYQDVLDGIEEMSRKQNSSRLIREVFTFIYLAMVAEENKIRAPLGKRVKALAMHQLLIEGLPPHIVAECSKGKGWRLLQQWCEQRGI